MTGNADGLSEPRPDTEEVHPSPTHVGHRRETEAPLPGSRHTPRERQPSAQQLQDLLGSVEEIAWSITPDTGEVLYVSPAIERIYARPARAFQEDPHLWIRMIHPDDRLRVLQSGRQLASLGTLDDEYRILRDDGVIRWIHNRSRAVRAADGRLLRLDGIMADITERKGTDQELRWKNAFLEALARSTLDGILVVDPNGRKIFQNERTVELWRIPRGIADDPDDTRQVEHVAHSVVDPRAFADLVRYLYEHPEEKSRDEILLKDGRVLDRYSAPVLGADGGNYGRIWTFRDITDRVRTDRELRRLITEFEQISTAASHDLREPLRAVASYTQLLVRRCGSVRDAGTEQFAAFITDGVEQMSEVIDGLQRFVTVSRAPLQAASVDLNVVFNRAVLHLDEKVRSSSAVLTRERLPTLRVDPYLMSEVFGELLDNALKFRGARPPVVHLAVQAGASEWTFALHDNGIGVAPAYADRVFELYRRLHPPERFPGRGVGLAVCRKIIERHGGRMWLEPGNSGTVVRFTLPRPP